jgi:hypothetical protein
MPHSTPGRPRGSRNRQNPVKRDPDAAFRHDAVTDVSTEAGESLNGTEYLRSFIDPRGNRSNARRPPQQMNLH